MRVCVFLRMCVCVHSSLFSLPSQPANEIFIYFSEQGRRVVRNSNEMSYLIVSSCEEGGDRGNRGLVLLLNYIGRIQRGVITGQRGRGYREYDRDREMGELVIHLLVCVSCYFTVTSSACGSQLQMMSSDCCDCCLL